MNWDEKYETRVKIFRKYSMQKKNESYFCSFLSVAQGLIHTGNAAMSQIRINDDSLRLAVADCYIDRQQGIAQTKPPNLYYGDHKDTDFEKKSVFIT